MHRKNRINKYPINSLWKNSRKTLVSKVLASTRGFEPLTPDAPGQRAMSNLLDWRLDRTKQRASIVMRLAINFFNHAIFFIHPFLKNIDAIVS